MDNNLLSTQLIRYDQGLLSNKETLVLFSRLVKAGLVQALPVDQRRLARSLIKSGCITCKGELVKKYYK